MTTIENIPSNPFGSSIRAEDIKETLAFFDTWEDRYQYIIDLGKELPPMDDELKTDERLGVSGYGGNDEGKARHIFGSEPHPHVGITQVNFRKYTGPKAGSADRILASSLSSALLNWTASHGACRLVASLRPLKL